MAKTKKAKISFVFIGQDHRDPIPLALATEHLQALHKKGIPVAICEEAASDTTAVLELEKTKAVDKNNDVIKQNFVEKQFKGSLNISSTYKPHMSQESIEKIKGAATELGFNRNGEFDYLEYHLALKEQVKLYSTLQELKVNYYGIEADRETRIKMTQLYHQITPQTEEKMLPLLEKKRMTTMTENLLKGPVEEMRHKGGGVIFIVNLGRLHTHRLAANLAIAMESQKYSDIECQFYPMECFSDYFKAQDIHYHDLRAKKHDSQEIHQKYSQIECKTVPCKEDIKTGVVSAPLFDKAMQSVLASHEKLRFTVFGPTTKKLEMVAMLDGEVIEKNETAFTFSIESNKLKKEVREALGIERKLLTLDAPDEIVPFLEKDGSITIEPTENKKKFLVTFPQEKSELITKVVYKWPEISKDLKQKEKGNFEVKSEILVDQSSSWTEKSGSTSQKIKKETTFSVYSN